MIEKNGTIYFTDEELKCKGSGKLHLAPMFASHLLELRLDFNEPMTPISCCRSTEHNTTIGGATHSLHICDNTRGCCAIDIATPDSGYRTRLVRLALAKGWSVGIKRTMVHLDRRSDYSVKEEQILFLY